MTAYCVDKKGFSKSFEIAWPMPEIVVPVYKPISSWDIIGYEEKPQSNVIKFRKIDVLAGTSDQVWLYKEL